MRTLFDETMKYGRLVLSVTVVGMMLTACGGSDAAPVDAAPIDDSPGSDDGTQKVLVTSGTFVSAVEGLDYTCEDGTEGVTDSSGKVECADGGTVTFDLFGYELGSTPMRENISPLDFTDDKEAALNIAQLLMTVDEDSDASNGIKIDEMEALFLVFMEMTTDEEDFDEQLGAYLETDAVSEDEARRHFNTLLRAVDKPTFTVFVLSQEEIDSDVDGTVDSVSTYTYDADGNRLTSSHDDGADGTVDRVTTYTYDADGNLLTWRKDVDGDGADDTFTRNYYENGDWVKQEVDFGNDGTIEKIVINTYDSNHVWLEQTRDGENQDDSADSVIDYIWTYKYDVNGNRLELIHDNNADGTVDTIWEYTYDAEGNLLTERYDPSPDHSVTGGITYTYDTDGKRLTTSWDQEYDGVVDTIYTYTYDTDGNLLTENQDYDADGTVDAIATSTWIEI